MEWNEKHVGVIYSTPSGGASSESIVIVVGMLENRGNLFRLLSLSGAALASPSNNLLRYLIILG
jgi:hypothetical protein